MWQKTLYSVLNTHRILGKRPIGFWLKQKKNKGIILALTLGIALSILTIIIRQQGKTTTTTNICNPLRTLDSEHLMSGSKRSQHLFTLWLSLC